jgi:alkylation response protein AidB-like acyl-CoA dehydrogenase
VQQPGIPPVFGGINYRAPGRNALGMHASVGISVDLQDIAYRHPGLKVVSFTTMLANVGEKGWPHHGKADFWVLLDGKLTPVDAAKVTWISAQVQNEVLDHCVQLPGGYGYMNAARVARAWRDARVTKIWAGTNEIMKELIGRDLGL